MSSLIDASMSSGTPSNGDGENGIIHFDATMRRKERMRQLAAGDKSTGTAVAEKSGNGDAAAHAPAKVVAPAPAAAARPVVQAPAPTARPVAPVPLAAKPVAAAPVPRPVAPARVAAPVPALRPQAVVPAPAAKAPVSGGMTGKALEQFLIKFVVEQTGYPEEMVELDADLEADLGIDSIKKAQLFGELAEHFDVSAVQVTEGMSLDNYPTLRHVLQFIERIPQKGAAGSTSATPAAPAAAPAVAAAPKPVAPAAAARPVVQAPAPTARPVAPAPAARPVTPVPLAAKPVAAAPVPRPVAPARVAAPVPALRPQAVVPAPAAKAPVSGGMTGKALEQFLIKFVVEQTGYPEEMVELDADLEADLGIDSIKKAQLFGELAEHFDVSAVQVTEGMSLDNYPTLRHVLQFIERIPQKGAAGSTSATPAAPAAAPAVAAAPKSVAPAPAPARVAAPTPVRPAATPAPAPRAAMVSAPKAAAAPVAAKQVVPAGMSGKEFERFLINFVVEQTGYPEEMVDMDADLEADLGIDSIKKAQLFGELAEHFDISSIQVNEGMSLDDYPTLRHVMNFLAGVPRKTTV